MAIKEIFTVEEADTYLELGLLWFARNDGRKWSTGYEWAPLHDTTMPWSLRDYEHYRCGIMLEE